MIEPSLAKSPGALRLLALNRVVSPDDAAREAIDRALQLRFEDPAGMLAWARLAAGLSAGPRVSALAHTHLGNAYRINGEYARARLHLDLAEHSRHSPRALLFSLKAALFENLFRFDAALSYLRIAASLYAADGDADGKAGVLVLTGILAGRADRHEESAELCQAALETVALNKAVLRAAVQGVARGLTATGQPERALAVLQKAHAAFEDCGPLNRLKHAWLRGQIAGSCGDPQLAASHLEEARLGFHSLGQMHDACLVTLELAIQQEHCGRTREARRLLKPIPRLLIQMGLSPQAEIAAALRFSQAAGWR